MRSGGLLFIATLAATAVFFALAGSASAQADGDRCDKHCYSGSTSFGQSMLSYSFSVVPCAPAVVLRPQFMMDGEIVAVPKGASFSCESSGSTMSISFVFGTGRRLTWNYQTEASCPTIVADISTIQGTYLGSDHLFDDVAQLSDDDLTGYEVLCDSSSCEPLTYNSGNMEFSGLSGSKSPCGLNGTTECKIAIEFSTAGNCESAATPRAAVVGMQVTVQPGDVRMTSFRPSALVNPTLLCYNGALTFQSAGVVIEWAAPTSNTANCAAILSDLKNLATGEVISVAIDLGEGEIWEATTGPALASRTIAKPTTTGGVTSGGGGGPDTDNGEDTETPAQSEALPVGVYRPVQPTAYCNYHYGDGECCAVYGYRNPNMVNVNVSAVKGKNFLVPYTIEGQPMVFLANHTQAIAFSVVWKCRKYERHMKTWTVHTVGSRPGVVFRREAVVSRQMDNCDFLGLSQCGVITGDVTGQEGANVTSTANATETK